MKNLILIIAFLLIAISSIAQKSPIQIISNFKSKIATEKIKNTKIGCRTKIAKDFFEVGEYADVKRYFLKNGKFEKAGFSKNKMVGGFSFSPQQTGKYFVIVTFNDSKKNRVLEIDVSQDQFDIVVFENRPGLKHNIRKM